MLLPESVLDGQTLGRLDRWRKARALFLRADGPEAERAVSLAIGRAWARAQVYGRARRLLMERSVEKVLSHLESSLGVLAEKVRVAPEDPAQTKWDALRNSEDLDVCFSERVFAAQSYSLARPDEAPGQASPEFSEWLSARRVSADAPLPPPETVAPADSEVR